jgi:hypothetical protein
VEEAYASMMKMAGGNPMGMFNMMMANVPDFAKLVNSSRGLSREQVARSCGLSEKDIDALRRLIG